MDFELQPVSGPGRALVMPCGGHEAAPVARTARRGREASVPTGNLAGPGHPV
jgi:hypothetical protein